MRKQVVTGFVPVLVAVSLIAVSPLTALAQGSGLDEETRDTVVAMVHEVGHVVAPTVVSAEGAAVGDEDEDSAPAPQAEEPAEEPTEEPTEEPDVIEEPSAPNPDTEGPETEPEGESTLPELNLSDLAEYTSQGVTIKAPADWVVTTDIAEDTPFMIEVPDTELQIGLGASFGMDFPSWLGLALFRSQSDLLIGELGEDAQVEESSTLETAQGLPMVKLSFSGTEDDNPMGGSFYVLAPSQNAFVLTATGPADQWRYAIPGLDLIANSITFDPNQITSIKIGDQPEDFSDDDETIQVTAPAGWYAMSTGDEQFPIILAEPEVRYVAAVGSEGSLGEDFDPDVLKDFVDDAGELDPSKYSDLIHSIAEQIGNTGGEMRLDEEESQVIPRDGAILVKLVGDAQVEEDLAIPVIIYVDLRNDSAAVVALFGDTESAAEVDEDMQTMAASVTNLGGEQ